MRSDGIYFVQVVPLDAFEDLAYCLLCPFLCMGLLQIEKALLARMLLIDFFQLRKRNQSISFRAHDDEGGSDAFDLGAHVQISEAKVSFLLDRGLQILQEQVNDDLRSSDSLFHHFVDHLFDVDEGTVQDGNNHFLMVVGQVPDRSNSPH
jgi:HJR/Mrr/RecB family endonuclease